MKPTDRKHLLIIGKSAIERHRFVEDLVSNTNKEIYSFQPYLKSFEDYIENVRRNFPFVPINWAEQNPNKWTINQVWDFHLDWTENTNGILIVIEEFGGMEERWKLEILRVI